MAVDSQFGGPALYSAALSHMRGPAPDVYVHLTRWPNEGYVQREAAPPIAGGVC